MTLRYTLVKQLHFLGKSEGAPTVVTMQRWDALRAAKRRSDLVILNDGAVKLSKNCRSATDLQWMDDAFAESNLQYGSAALTEAQARDLIAERTGTRPADRSCGNRHCSMAVPLGAQRCEHGHQFHETGGGSGHRFPAGREIFLPTGGTK